jgi:nitrate reductase beta subunit
MEDPYGERSGCGFSFGDGCHTHGVSRLNLFGSKKPREREQEPPTMGEGK